MRAMITNGGPHPADKWADVTTDTLVELIEVKEDSDTPEAALARQAKRDLRTTLFKIFNAHHDGVQKHHREHLKKNVKHAAAAAEHVASRIDVTPHMSVLDEVDAVFAESPFAEHFAKPEVKQIVHTIVGQHTANAIDIERKWHKDRLEAVKGA